LNPERAGREFIS